MNHTPSADAAVERLVDLVGTTVDIENAPTAAVRDMWTVCDALLPSGPRPRAVEFTGEKQRAWGARNQYTGGPHEVWIIGDAGQSTGGSWIPISCNAGWMGMEGEHFYATEADARLALQWQLYDQYADAIGRAKGGEG